MHLLLKGIALSLGLFQKLNSLCSHGVGVCAVLLRIMQLLLEENYICLKCNHSLIS